MLNVTFYGVRAPGDAAGADRRRYGAHSACVVLEAPGWDPLFLDLGTGLAEWAAAGGTSGSPVAGKALLTTTSARSVAGLAALEPAPDFEVFGPAPAPALPGIRFHDVDDEHLAIGGAEVTVRSVAHSEPANGYRVEWQGLAIAYIGEHAPAQPDKVAYGVLEVADSADLLIHDARGSDGHSTVDYAVLVAREAGAERLALYNHHPALSDESIDEMLDGARRTAGRFGVSEVLAAMEGLTVSFERAGGRGR